MAAAPTSTTKSGFCAYGTLDGHKWCRNKACTCTLCDHIDRDKVKGEGNAADQPMGSD